MKTKSEQRCEADDIWDTLRYQLDNAAGLLQVYVWVALLKRTKLPKSQSFVLKLSQLLAVCVWWRRKQNKLIISLKPFSKCM